MVAQLKAERPLAQPGNGVEVYPNGPVRSKPVEQAAHRNDIKARETGTEGNRIQTGKIVYHHRCAAVDLPPVSAVGGAVGDSEPHAEVGMQFLFREKMVTGLYHTSSREYLSLKNGIHYRTSPIYDAELSQRSLCLATVACLVKKQTCGELKASRQPAVYLNGSSEPGIAFGGNKVEISRGDEYSFDTVNGEGVNRPEALT